MWVGGFIYGFQLRRVRVLVVVVAIMLAGYLGYLGFGVSDEMENETTGN